MADLKNWAGNLTYGASQVHRPETVEELQAIVRGAGRLKALGSRHSFSDIADTEGHLVSLEKFQSVSPVDRQAGTVTVGGGVTYGLLAPVLQREGYALRNLASLPHISVVGAAATGTHGSGVRNQSLSAAVKGLEFVDGEGNLVRLQQGDPDFEGAVVGLGALGFVVSATLEVIPTFELEQGVYEGLPYGTAFGNFDEIVSDGYSVSLFTSWQDHGIDQVWIKDVPGRDWGDSYFGAQISDGPRHPCPGMPMENCTEQLGVAGPWHERLPHFKLEFTPSSGLELQTEYLVDRAVAPDALRAIHGLRGKIAPLLFISEIRTVAADDLWLSPSYGRESVAVHFTWKQETEAVMKLIPEIEAALEPFDARPHWGKLSTLGRARLAQVYPKLNDFSDLAKRYDPQGKLRNRFLNERVF